MENSEKITHPDGFTLILFITGQHKAAGNPPTDFHPMPADLLRGTKLIGIDVEEILGFEINSMQRGTAVPGHGYGNGYVDMTNIAAAVIQNRVMKHPPLTIPSAPECLNTALRPDICSLNYFYENT